MVSYSQLRILALYKFIAEQVQCPKGAATVSDPKGDGTVFVKFTSRTGFSSNDMSRRFSRSLEGTDRRAVQTDTNKFRLALDQF